MLKQAAVECIHLETTVQSTVIKTVSSKCPQRCKIYFQLEIIQHIGWIFRQANWDADP